MRTRWSASHTADCQLSLSQAQCHAFSCAARVATWIGPKAILHQRCLLSGMLGFAELFHSPSKYLFLI